MDSYSRPSLRKRCRSENRLENRIDALPDEVLISIISLFNLKDAAKTSVLSRRWRYLWTQTTGKLDFDGSKFNPSETRLIDWVNQVLNVHKGSTIDEFKVCFGVSNGSSDVVNRWIKFALEKRVKRLFLDFKDNKFSLKTRVFDNCRLGSLTHLHLNKVDMSDKVCKFVLSSFPLLQHLHLNSVSSLASLTITDLSSCLSSLKIKQCLSLRHLEIRATNLVSFTYNGPKVQNFFNEVSRVDNVFSCISRLESLKLDLRYWSPQPLLLAPRAPSRFPKLPNFVKLNYLEFSWPRDYVSNYIRMFTLLLEASPLLQRFVFKHYTTLGNIDLKNPSKKRVQYRQLKVIEFHEFGGYEQEVKLALHLCAMLPGLETLVVKPRPVHPLCQFGEYDVAIAIKRARRMQRLLPEGVKLVIKNQFSPFWCIV